MKIYHELRSEKRVYSESPSGARLLRKPIAPSDYSAPGFVSVVYGEGQMEARVKDGATIRVGHVDKRGPSMVSRRPINLPKMPGSWIRPSAAPIFTSSELQRMGSPLTIGKNQIHLSPTKAPLLPSQRQDCSNSPKPLLNPQSPTIIESTLS